MFGCYALMPKCTIYSLPKNGYLNRILDSLYEYASGGGSWVLDNAATNHTIESDDMMKDLMYELSNHTSVPAKKITTMS